MTRAFCKVFLLLGMDGSRSGSIHVTLHVLFTVFIKRQISLLVSVQRQAALRANQCTSIKRTVPIRSPIISFIHRDLMA